MRWRWLFVLVTLVLAACSTGGTSDGTQAPAAASQGNPTVLRLATTTSTYDSGLLDAILPGFEREHNARVEVIAVGTGQSLKIGENGDADVVLVHARELEDKFVADGYGINRRDVMYNDFIIVGPADDPANVAEASDVSDAFTRIAEAEAPFVSRGDESGTYVKEQAIWTQAGITPDPASGWYRSLGQGMGETLVTANEQLAYTLTDRGTYLAAQDQLPDLSIIFGGQTVAENDDPMLRNPYGVIQVNPELHEGIEADLAAAFVDWIVSPAVQEQIGEFGKDKYGQALFNPLVTQ